VETQAAPCAGHAQARLEAIFGPDHLSRLQAKRVAVVGCGALGAHDILHLAMLRVGEIILVDNGYVDPPNLGNQAFDTAHLDMPKVLARAEQIHRINPRCRVITLNARLEELGMGALRHVDLVFSCLDSLRSRIELNERCRLLSVPWVDAATSGDGESMYGKVASFGSAPESACFICSYDSGHLADALERDRRPCASWWNAREDASLPTLSASPECAVVAGLQCIHALRRLLDEEPADVSLEQLVNLDVGAMQTLALERNKRCLLPHTSFGPLIEAGAAHDTAIGETLDIAANALGETAVLAFHKKAFVTTLQCIECGAQKVVGKLDAALEREDALCPNGHLIAPTPLSLHAEVHAGELAPFAGRSWAEAGLPRDDVVTARANGKSVHFVLA